MKGWKFIWIGMLLAGGGVFFSDLTAQRKVIERIVARVNDDIITLSEYNYELERLRGELSRSVQGEELEKQFELQKPNVLESLIQSKLLVQKAKDLGFGNKIDQEVNSYIEGFRKQNGIPDMRSLEQALRQAGMSMARWRDDIKNSILQEALIGTFVQSKVVTTDEELQKYYNSHKEEFTKPGEVELAEIVFFLEGKKEEDVRTKANSALNALKGGEDFAAVAKKMSEGSTAQQGGGIGTFKLGTMSADVQNAVKNLTSGKFSEIIKSKFGYQILKVVNRKEQEMVPLAEVKKTIQAKVYYEKYRPMLDKYLKEVRDESFVEIYGETMRPQG